MLQGSLFVNEIDVIHAQDKTNSICWWNFCKVEVEVEVEVEVLRPSQESNKQTGSNQSGYEPLNLENAGIAPSVRAVKTLMPLT